MKESRNVLSDGLGERQEVTQWLEDEIRGVQLHSDKSKISGCMGGESEAATTRTNQVCQPAL